MRNETPESIAESILDKWNANSETGLFDSDWIVLSSAIAEAIRKERVVRVPKKKQTDEILDHDIDYGMAIGHNDLLDQFKKLNEGKTFVEGEWDERL